MGPHVGYCKEGGVTGYGRREVDQKSHMEVGGSRILDWDVGGLDFAGQFRDVRGFVSKRFSPKQRHQIDTNQAIPSAKKARRIQTPIGLEYPEMYALDHKSYFLKPSSQFLPLFEEKLQITTDKSYLLLLTKLQGGSSSLHGSLPAKTSLTNIDH